MDVCVDEQGPSLSTFFFFETLSLAELQEFPDRLVWLERGALEILLSLPLQPWRDR